MNWACHTRQEVEIRSACWWQTMKQSDHLEKESTEGRIILNSRVNWIQPVQDNDQLWSLISTAMDFIDYHHT
jgi:hypothetical protein